MSKGIKKAIVLQQKYVDSGQETIRAKQTL